MLADDFAGHIALDALGARVPGGDPAFRVEHEDRIVGDALDQQPETPLGFEQGFLRLHLLGHVAGDLGKADEPALFVVDAVDDHAGPEAAAVLAHAPALALIFAFAPRGLEHLARKTGLAVLVGVEFGEMLADDLLGLEPLDLLGARVPAGHDPVGRQHVDRIIDDRLDQELERIGRRKIHALQIALHTNSSSSRAHTHSPARRSTRGRASGCRARDSRGDGITARRLGATGRRAGDGNATASPVPLLACQHLTKDSRRVRFYTTFLLHTYLVIYLRLGRRNAGWMR